eukprot:CAMPEP_0178588574 /NCGR_PEP_ID=MMETSP0697-20121206/27109_1 /TAXON_ID=265572 /ORGANISM="Extubocellulus spinifer, Strain CCMP396" /LENGTH=446 /DNA_ID=CAMNT_0020224939 /DNA_START=103 /DNA_END=1440 /DNA_ORIENTATION=-
MNPPPSLGYLIVFNPLWTILALIILCLNGGLTFLRINSVGGDGNGGGGGVPSSHDVITNGALFQPAGGPLPNPPPQTVLDARSKRWEDELDEYCRFPSFVNNDYTYFRIRKGTHMMEYSDDLRKGHFRSVLSDTRVKNGKRLERDQKLHNSTGRKSISFLHLGKAGGSSLVCNIMPKHSAHCEGGKKRTLVPSAISKMTNCYVHYDNDMHCYDNPTLAINIRNPIDRMASWYHYEHLDNLQELWGDSIRTCGQHMLFKCYSSFHDLAEYGLAGTRPPPTQLLRVEYNASEEICRHWAWASIQGTASASHHNVWNYDWYGSPALAFQREIIVFRTEHSEEDWRRIDRMLGGPGNLPENMHLNDASGKNIAVYNKTVTELGRLNLCRALCQEIQIYKMLLSAAVNLNEKDVQISLRELNCPGDLHPEPRKCPESYIDYFVEKEKDNRS